MNNFVRTLVLPILALLALAACSTTASPAPTTVASSDTIIIGYSAPGLVGAQLDIQ
ncbi:MAG: hypothetical protein HXY37_15395 [Chloroflexi bacterium]|nr:hypothetical protein [Chloroflexota bacterium]